MGKKTEAGKAAAQTQTAKPLVIGTVVVVVLLAILFLVSQKGGNPTAPIAPVDQSVLVNQPVMGEASAPVTVVEFGDYLCPACKAWGELIYPQLEKEYIDTGKVKFAFVNVLFHGEASELASLAAESVFAQNPEAYWSFHKAIYDAQPKQDHDALWVTPEKLIALARTHVPQIDLTRLEADLKSKKAAPELKVDVELVRKYRVQLTPSIMINGTMLNDPFDYKAMKSLIDKALGGK